MKLNSHVKTVLDQASLTKKHYLREKIAHSVQMANTIEGLVQYLYEEKKHNEVLFSSGYFPLFPKILQENKEKKFHIQKNPWSLKSYEDFPSHKSLEFSSSPQEDENFFYQFQPLITHYLKWFSAAQDLNIHILIREGRENQQDFFRPVIVCENQSLIYFPYAYNYGHHFSWRTLDFLYKFLLQKENFLCYLDPLLSLMLFWPTVPHEKTFSVFFQKNNHHGYGFWHKKSFLFSEKFFSWASFFALIPSPHKGRLFMKSIDVFTSREMGYFSFFSPRGDFLLLLCPLKKLQNSFLLLALPLNQILVQSVRQGLFSQEGYKYFLEERDAFIQEYFFYFFLFSAGLIVLAIIVGLVFTRGLVGPTSYLIQEAENIQERLKNKKGLQKTLSSFTGFCLPQMRNLLKIFNDMIVKIRGHQEELEEINGLLQRRQVLLSQALLLLKERQILLSGILQGDSSGIIATNLEGILQIYNLKAQEFFYDFLPKKIQIIPGESHILDLLPSLEPLIHHAREEPNHWSHQQLSFTDFSGERTLHFHCCLVDGEDGPPLFFKESLQSHYGDYGPHLPLREPLKSLDDIFSAQGSQGDFHNNASFQEESFFHVFQSSKNPKILVITFDDISALIAIEKKNAWMEMAQRLTHEIKNPLTPIGLSAERLQKRLRSLFQGLLQNYGEKDKMVIHDCLETIIRQTKNISSLVSQFSHFAQIEKAKECPFDLAALLRRLVHFYEESYGHFVFLYHGPFSLIFLGNEGQLEQVFINLIKNSIESMEEKYSNNSNGEPLKIQIFLKEKTKGLSVHFWDEGMGLSSQALQDLNKGLKSLKNLSLSKKRNGMGLGLLIVESILLHYKTSLHFRRHNCGIHIFFFLEKKEHHG